MGGSLAAAVFWTRLCTTKEGMQSVHSPNLPHFRQGLGAQS